MLFELPKVHLFNLERMSLGVSTRKNRSSAVFVHMSLVVVGAGIHHAASTMVDLPRRLLVALPMKFRTILVRYDMPIQTLA